MFPALTFKPINSRLYEGTIIMSNWGKIFQTIWLIIKGLLWPLFEQLFMSDFIIKYGIYIFIVLVIYGGVMTCSQKRKVRHVVELLAGIIGTIYMLSSN